MLTTVFLRTAAATVALTVITSSAGAQTAATGTTPPAQATTTPEQAAPAATPSAATTPAGNAVANATAPAAPATPPAVTPPATAPATAAAPATTPPATTPAAAPAPPAATQAATPPAATPPAAPGTPAPAEATTQTPAATTPPAATATTPPATTTPAAPAAPVQAAVPAPPPADPTIAALRTWLGNSANTSKAFKGDAAAAVAFYGARTGGPLWVEASGFNAKAKSAMDEVRKADEWGLSASAFDLPSLAAGASTEAQAEAEGKLTLELLKYARFAKGGRVNPASLSRVWDQVPPVKDPNTVMAELAATASPDAYLREQHPTHPQFQLLHKALLKARGPSEPAVEVDPALKINLPQTKETLKVGIDHPNVALLRQRLKVPAEGGVKDTLFDEKLELALKAYQVEKAIKATGQLSGATRVSLNREVEGQRAPDPERGTQMIVLNMERWRWMPENLGAVYVWNNIPEYTTRTMKGSETVFKERIIVGLPQWSTPIFSESMKTIVFNPSWGMPDGIKTRELAPRLRSAGGGFLFFGGGGGGNIIRAYGLDVYRGGRKIDPDSIDWSNADVRAYSFIQPPGGKNPLGTVKFLFPNKHDVYMHDTIERSLFAQPSRALSHGCIRVQNPRKFAEVMIEYGNHVDQATAQSEASGGGDITLKHPIPVHMTYFTAVADEQGRVSTFSDIYGHDSRLSAALTGRALRDDPGIETSSADDATAYADEPMPPANRKKKKSKSGPDTLADAISGFWMN